MLVLTRKSGERLELEIDGTVVQVTVVRITGRQVKLGIAAPEAVRVKRGELVDPTLRREAA